MKTTNPLAGKRITWTFSDGEMANRSFAHTFDRETVSWQLLDGDSQKPSTPTPYVTALVGQYDVAVSYCVPGAATLTVIMDMTAHTLVAFSSDGKKVARQIGTFEINEGVSRADRREHALT